MLLDRDNFHLLSRTRLWSLRSHMASLTASSVPERLEQPLLSLLQTPILLLLGSAPTSPTDMSISDFNRSAHGILQGLLPAVSTSNYEKPFWLKKSSWKHKADVLQRFNLESSEKHIATFRCTWFWSQFNISGDSTTSIFPWVLKAGNIKLPCSEEVCRKGKNLSQKNQTWKSEGRKTQSFHSISFQFVWKLLKSF